MVIIIDLVRQAQQGDEDAFLAVFQTYEADLYRTAYVYMGNPEDALDVVQEAAYRSFKSIGGLKDPQYCKTWLIRITISCAIDMLRKRRQEVLWRPEYTEQLAAAESEDLPLALTLRQLVDTLDEDEKHLVILRFYYDLTIREAAELMALPLGTAKTLLYRALAKLRSRVAEEGSDGYQ